jgi:hypothetical protein
MKGSKIDNNRSSKPKRKLKQHLCKQRVVEEYKQCNIKNEKDGRNLGGSLKQEIVLGS